MDLQKKENLDLVSVYELMGNSFFIPDYQRGYRWTEKEVEKLFDDLDEFFKEKSEERSFYCLQPLVVYYHENEEKWEVIDGQQRLTTLFLLLSRQEQLLKQIYDVNLFEISYDTREDSARFLKNIDLSHMNDNIDYYHICKAVQTIDEKLKECSLGPWRFIDSLLNANDDESKPSVKFIWYNVTDEIKAKNICAEEKFSNLNIGKIGLTNAELIKALLLNCVKENESEQLRIASEWDHIEHSLQDDSLWSFLYGEEDGKYATRIEMIFDIVKDKPNDERYEYFTFDRYVEEIRKYSGRIITNIVSDLWKDISDMFYRFCGWYQDKNLYHIIGYLRYLKIDIKEINRIFEEDSDDIEDFYKRLKKKAIDTVMKKNTAGNGDSEKSEYIDIRALEYDKQRKLIYKILLLFSVLSIIDCDKETYRFSFEQFYKDSWDIEHVRSQTPKDISGDARFDWIVCNIEYYSGVEYDRNNKEKIDSYREQVEKSFGQEIRDLDQRYKRICLELLELLGKESNIAESDIYKELDEKEFKQDKSFVYEDNIGNLVLLDSGTNRGYKNAFFPVKRRWINRREREGIYILPCTKNVFSKNYSKRLYDLMNWNNDDAEAYMDEIERILDYGNQ